MAKEIIAPENVSSARGYSQAIKVGNTIYVSGQTARDLQGNIIEGDCLAQAYQIFENMKRVLEAAGASMQDVVKLNFYFANLKDLSKIGDAFRNYFGRHYPAGTAIQVDSLYRPEMLLEVDAIAVIE